MNIREIKINSYDKKIYDANMKHWDNIIKPLNSMGKFEPLIARIGAIQGSLCPNVKKRILLVYAADNGIVDERVTQSDQSVTATCTEGIAAMEHSVSVMARATSTDIKVVDVGVNYDFNNARILDKKLRHGSRNFAKEPALTEEELTQAIITGIELVKCLKAEGYEIIAVGEMGIGNTTTSTAVACALLKKPAKELTGRGAGLDNNSLLHKAEVIQSAIDKYSLYDSDVMKILMTVGGYDIAAMVGTYIGGAIYGIPVVMDGMISAVALLAAERICMGVCEYAIPSHMSKEPTMKYITDELGIEPVIDANMALGEGTGAVLMMQLLDTANEVFLHASVFEEKRMTPYEHFENVVKND